MFGTGKATLTQSFSESLKEREQLAASCFRARTVLEWKDTAPFIPTIAYTNSVSLHSALGEVLTHDPGSSAKNMTKQSEGLLKVPLLPNNLAVIDVLGERGAMWEVELFPSIPLISAAHLPLKFLAKSRSGFEI